MNTFTKQQWIAEQAREHLRSFLDLWIKDGVVHGERS